MYLSIYYRMNKTFTTSLVDLMGILNKMCFGYCQYINCCCQDALKCCKIKILATYLIAANLSLKKLGNYFDISWPQMTLLHIK